MASDTIQLDRRLSLGEQLSDLAVIHGPDPDLPPSEYAVGILDTLSKMAQAIDDETRMYVYGAVRAGATWQQIGDALGVSRQAAHKRFGSVVGTIDRLAKTPAGERYVDARTSRHFGQPSGS